MNKEDKYLKLLIELLPPGKAWSVERDKTLRNLLVVFAKEFVRLEEYIQFLYLESNPQTTEYFLEDWEKDFGLPDECSFLAENFEERRNNLVAKVFSMLGSSIKKEDFRKKGKDFGLIFNIISEFEEYKTTKSLLFSKSLKVSRDTLFFDFLNSDANKKAQSFWCRVEKIKPAHIKIVQRGTAKKSFQPVLYAGNTAEIEITSKAKDFFETHSLLSNTAYIGNMAGVEERAYFSQ